jgi:hypothetical protein
MAAHYAEFRWSLPPEKDSIGQFVDALTRSAGYRCQWEFFEEDSPGSVSASLSFPHVSKNNLIALSGDQGTLDFAAIPFFWAHTIAAVRELGGVVLRSLPPVSDLGHAPPWRELRWADRARILCGFGAWVQPLANVAGKTGIGGQAK